MEKPLTKIRNYVLPIYSSITIPCFPPKPMLAYCMHLVYNCMHIAYSQGYCYAWIIKKSGSTVEDLFNQSRAMVLSPRTGEDTGEKTGIFPAHNLSDD